MSLELGTFIGPYEVLSALGAGGMGEVYRARDTKLNRDVAIKVLPESVAGDPDHLARFRREAQVLAALNHPHIAQIYGLEEIPSAGPGPMCALVMELVEGPTLADSIALGPLAVADALPIARQIADALDAAHERGIIHRDLKPANIKVRSDGTVKVLDFGLAKAFESAPESGLGLTNSPTLSMQATHAGLILGTAAYMSPEQASGKAVDKRTDIWSFGVVLWEMLTGRRLFEGETISHTLADVLRAEIDFDQLPAQTPAAIRDLLGRCLDRDATRRLRDIGEARIVVERAVSEKAWVMKGGTGRHPMRTSVAWRTLPWAIAGLALATAGVSRLTSISRPSVGAAEKIALSAELGADAALVQNSGVAAILSPDGRRLVFTGTVPAATIRPQLYTRRLDQLEAVPLRGTEGAVNPFFSPDGQWVAFFADGKLKKISVSGGAAVTLCDASNFGSGWWDPSDTIFVSLQNQTGLMRVSAAGGTPAMLTTLGENEATHKWPQALPGGRAVLYTAQASANTYGDASAFVQPLAGGTAKLVVADAHNARYMSSGHLVFIRDRTLFAVPFDIERLKTTGQAVPVLEGVATNRFGGAQFDVSPSGTLVYVPGQAGRDNAPIHWMGHDGKTSPLRDAAIDWSNISFAPDGRRLAVDVSNGKATEVWTYEWSRDTLSRVTFQGNSQKPVWTPDGRRIAFVSTAGGNGALNIFWQRADGTGDVQRLTESPSDQGVWSFHPSGKFLAYHEYNNQGTNQTRDDILILPIEGDEASGWKPGKPTVFLKTPFAERAPIFSPDGRWLAYQSTETGRDEVFVRPFPSGIGKWQVSTDGGVLPTWSRTRHELLYATPNQRLMVVPYSVDGDSFRAEKPRLWADGRFAPRARAGPNRSFDLHPDGDRLAFAPVADAAATFKQDKVVFVFNFFDELRRIAPATRK